MNALGRQASTPKSDVVADVGYRGCTLRQLPAMSCNRRGIETALRATDFYLLLLPMQGQQASSEFLTDFTKSKTTARAGISQPYDLLTLCINGGFFALQMFRANKFRPISAPSSRPPLRRYGMSALRVFVRSSLFHLRRVTRNYLRLLLSKVSGIIRRRVPGFNRRSNA